MSSVCHSKMEGAKMNTKQTVLFGVLALMGGIIGGILSDGLPGVAVAKPDVAKIIRAERFELVDDKGVERANLSIKGESTFFTLSDTYSKNSFILHNSPHFISLGLDNGNEHSVFMVSSDTGSNIYFDSKRFPRTRLSIKVDNTGNPKIQFYDEKGTIRLAMGNTELKNLKNGSTEIRSTGSIVIFNDEGKVVYAIP